MPDTTVLMSAVTSLPRQSLPRPHSISFATSLAPTAGITLSLYTLTDLVPVYSAASSMHLCCAEIISSVFATSQAPGTGTILTGTPSQTQVTVRLTFCLTTSAGVVLLRTVPQPHRDCGEPLAVALQGLQNMNHLARFLPEPTPSIFPPLLPPVLRPSCTSHRLGKGV